jgi:hypothetical protein
MDSGECVEDLGLAQMQDKEDFWARQPQSPEEVDAELEREETMSTDPRSPYYGQGWLDEGFVDCPYGVPCHGADCGACDDEHRCEVCDEVDRNGVATDQGFLCQGCRMGIARKTGEDPFYGVAPRSDELMDEEFLFVKDVPEDFAF